MQLEKFAVPDIRLYPMLVDSAKKIYGKFGSEEIGDMTTLAKLLNHQSSKSGQFLTKMACLRAYNLITGRGQVRLTDVGKWISYPSSKDEELKAVETAVLSIPLWKELHTKFPDGLPRENFWVDLQKITGLDAPKAQELENSVRRAYEDDIRYLKPTESEASKLTQTNPTQLGSTDLEEIKIGNDIRVWLPKDNMAEAWDKTKRMVDIYLGIDKPKKGEK